MYLFQRLNHSKRQGIRQRSNLNCLFVFAFNKPKIDWIYPGSLK
jgi:hypothetical protein